MMTFFANAALIILAFVSLLWLISIFLVNVSIIDIFWGFAYVLVNSSYFFQLSEWHLRNIVLLVLVSLWGIRLSLHLAWRNWGKGEDFRYREFRRKYGEQRYWWISFFQTFLLQGALVMLISLPLLAAQYNTANSQLNGFDYLGIAFWLLGFVFESGGDLQLAMFKRKPKNKGKLLTTGFWRYTRHPNYFGDAAVWWGFAFFSLAADAYWPIVGAVIMTWLLLKISGVALLEKTLVSTKPGYREYMEKTSAFIPWFPKK
ncbi:DUF1295 domain-containing protein [uncultured Draconibacterium sp.]|uniref:DUF1295 domain-containing protein n=1 Tax=uncultured Draconibacterium sp. TaxID=1573823 RepID=UPI0025D1F304|nr:DUF1295 domain-containing protein [uncultured Draconibacterium sp.]